MREATQLSSRWFVLCADGSMFRSWMKSEGAAATAAMIWPPRERHGKPNQIAATINEKVRSSRANDRVGLSCD